VLWIKALYKCNVVTIYKILKAREEKYIHEFYSRIHELNITTVVYQSVYRDPWLSWYFSGSDSLHEESGNVGR